MERLEAEKRLLQEKLDQPVSAPISPRTIAHSGVAGSALLAANLIGLPASAAAAATSSTLMASNTEQAANLTEHIINLRREVSRLKANLEKTERDHKENMAKLVREEKVIRDENVRLQRRLQMEVDRREALCRHLSESESSLEMDDERHFNESNRVRTISSPVPGASSNNTSANTAPPSMSMSMSMSATTPATAAAATILAPTVASLSSHQMIGNKKNKNCATKHVKHIDTYFIEFEICRFVN